MTKTEWDRVVAIIDDLITQRLGKYTPSETAMAEFENESMHGYVGYVPVTQNTIRELVLSIKQAFAALEPTGDGTLRYSNGNRVFMVNNDELYIYDKNGRTVMRIGNGTINILDDAIIAADLMLSKEALAAIQVNITRNEIDALWTL